MYTNRAPPAAPAVGNNRRPLPPIGGRFADPCAWTRLTLRATSIATSDLYRIIGSYANQSADIADPVEPIERSSSLSGNLVTERFI